MKRLFFTLVLATLATTLLNAQQNWFDKYKKLLNSNDTVALKKCIMQWEKANRLMLLLHGTIITLNVP